MADVVATILSLPDDGGEPIIRVDYRLNNGSPRNSGLTSPFTGPFTIVDGSNKNVQWRAVNSVDNDPDNWSDIKTVASSAPTLQASDSLTDRTLTVTVDAVTGVPTPVVTISGNVTFAGPDGGPWTYTAPSSENDFTVTWTVTAANGDIPDATVSGSELIPADILVPGTITPIVDPTVQRTFETQYVGALTDYETMIDPANYTTTSNGTINTPAIETQEDGAGPWTERDEEYSFLKDQVGRVHVTDTAGSDYTFTITTVEYEQYPQETVDFYAEIVVNEIVPQDEIFPIDFGSGASITTTKGVLAAGPVTVREVSYTGTAMVGQTLTIIPPLTACEKDLGPLVEVWSTTATNAVDTTDPAAPTLLIDAADTTFTITCTTTQGGNSVVSTTPDIVVEGDVMWVNPLWDDATDTFTSDYVGATRYDWAMYLASDGVPTVSDGVWSGITAENGGGSAAGSPINTTPPYSAGVLADRVIFAISNDTSQDTVIYEFTENAGGGVSLYRWNCSDEGDVPATDGGLDWVTDERVSQSNHQGPYDKTILGRDPGLPAYVPNALFTSQWYTGFNDDFNMSFEFATTGVNFPAGQYTVRVFLAETYLTVNDGREFNIDANGQTYFTNVDMHEEFGERVGGMKEFTTTVSGDERIFLTFVKLDGYDHPSVAGIEILTA